MLYHQQGESYGKTDKKGEKVKQKGGRYYYGGKYNGKSVEAGSTILYGKL